MNDSQTSKTPVLLCVVVALIALGGLIAQTTQPSSLPEMRIAAKPRAQAPVVPRSETVPQPEYSEPPFQFKKEHLQTASLLTAVVLNAPPPTHVLQSMWYYYRFLPIYPFFYDLNGDERARPLIFDEKDLRNIPEIWERAWGMEMPDTTEPHRRHGGVI